MFSTLLIFLVGLYLNQFKCDKYLGQPIKFLFALSISNLDENGGANILLGHEIQNRVNFYSEKIPSNHNDDKSQFIYYLAVPIVAAVGAGVLVPVTGVATDGVAGVVAISQVAGTSFARTPRLDDPSQPSSSPGINTIVEGIDQYPDSDATSEASETVQNQVPQNAGYDIEDVGAISDASDSVLMEEPMDILLDDLRSVRDVVDEMRTTLGALVQGVRLGGLNAIYQASEQGFFSDFANAQRFLGATIDGVESSLENMLEGATDMGQQLLETDAMDRGEVIRNILVESEAMGDILEEVEEW